MQPLTRAHDGPIDLIVDSTGLKILGASEWNIHKYKASKRRRAWRKLHIGVDEEGFIVAAALTPGSVDDASTLPDLLGQIEDPIRRFTADGAYDQRSSYDRIGAAGTEDVRIVIPPRRSESWNGYKLHIDALDGGLPVSCLLTSASLHDSQAACPLPSLTPARRTIATASSSSQAPRCAPARLAAPARCSSRAVSSPATPPRPRRTLRDCHRRPPQAVPPRNHPHGPPGKPAYPHSPSAHLAATIPINSCLQTLFQPLPRPPHPLRDTSRITAEPPTDAPRCLPPPSNAHSQVISQRLRSIRSLATGAAQASFSRSRTLLPRHWPKNALQCNE